MKLKTKVLSLLFAVFALYLAADYAIQKLVVYPNFLALEHDEAVKDLERAREAITRENEHLSTLCYDWADWDASYKYIEDRNEEYVSENLVLASFTEIKLNLIYFIDVKGEVVWGEIRDLDTEDIVELKMFPPNRFPEDHRLLRHESVESHIDGLVMTERGPMLISSRPILTTESKGPIRGTILLGRFLTQDIVKILKEQTRVDFQIWPIGSETIPSEDRLAVGSISPTSGPLIQERSDDLLAVYSTYSNINDNPGLLMRANVSRDISVRGAVAMRATVLSVIAAGVITLLILVFAIQRTVIGPISRLTTHATAIGTSSDLTATINLQRKDEIGILANEFDQMLAQLAEARKKLTEQTYMAGMAEMASGVLHNVRNSLTPLVGDLQLLRDKFKKASLKEAEEALTELDEGVASEERRNDLIRFSLLANKSLTSLIFDSDLKLGGAMEQIGHIEETLDDHQKWTYQDKVYEQIDLNELVHDSIKSIEKACKGFISIDVDPSLSEVGSVVGNRIILKQVFHNLIINAVESLQRKGEEHGKILIRAAIENKDGNDVKHVQFEDNGEGIEPEALKQVFERGYSTKGKAGSGIGLHWCANAIAAFNGKLYAESEGRGTGACFHLELPDKT